MRPDADAIRKQLDRIVASRAFASAERLRRFLRFVVEESLAGRDHELKEYTIGRHVCGRPESFDPKADPIVRVDANRLRTRLDAYYAAEGSLDSVRIQLPKGAYVPAIRQDQPTGTASLAVLPFANLSSGEQQAFFADSLTEELIHALTRVRNLRVIARSSAFAFKNRASDIREVGRLLNVEYAVEGSVRLAGGQLRITAQLIDTRGGWLMWSEKYERPWDNVFAVQDEIAASITDALRVQLTSELFAHPSPDPEAYADYLRGRHYWNHRTPESLALSLRCYEQAIARDPCCVSSYAGMADTLLVMALNDQHPSHELAPRAREAARRALELQPDSPESLVSLGSVSTIFDWNWEHGAECFDRATARRPGLSNAHYLYAIVNLSPRGLGERAISHMNAALQLDPVSPVLWRDLAIVHFLKRDSHQAAAAIARVEELAPGYGGALYWRARMALTAGNPGSAIRDLEQRIALGGANTRVRATLAYAWAAAGDSGRARSILDEVGATAPPLDLATIHLGLHETGQALDCLEQACQDHAAPLYQFAVDPLYDTLRAGPRGRRILASMNLPLITHP